MLFSLLDMSIRCEHVHRLKLWKYLNFFGLLWKLSKYAENLIYQLLTNFLFWTSIRCLKLNLVFISRLTSKCATQNLKKQFYSIDMLKYYGQLI